MAKIQSLIVKSGVVPQGLRRKCKRGVQPVINNWDWLTHPILKDLLVQKPILLAAIKADIEKKGIVTFSINRMIDNYGGTAAAAGPQIEAIFEKYLLVPGDCVQCILVQQHKYPNQLPYHPFFRDYPSCIFGNPEKQWDGGATATYTLQFLDKEYLIAVFTILKTAIKYDPAMDVFRWQWTDEQF